MITIRQPVNQFIDDTLRNKPASTMIADWRVDESVISNVIIAHFYSLGIYYVEPNVREILAETIIHQLLNSKIITTTVKKANEEEEIRRRRASAEMA